MKELGIYVSSFDEYSDLWDPFFNIFDKFWRKCDFQIYLVNNEKNYKRKNIKIINTGPEINWFKRNIQALENVEEEYILFMLEDYFISKNINNEDFYEIVRFMKLHKSYYYQLSINEEIGIKYKDVTQADSHIKYPISLQPAVWKKDYLLSKLKDINKESPWDFEDYFRIKYIKNKGKIEGVYYDTRDLLGYKNGVLRGKWIPSTVRYFEKKGISIELGERKYLSKYSEIKYALAIWASYHMSENIKSTIKHYLRVFHIDYLR